MPDVRVGQLWADNDPRQAGRTLRVVALADGKAVCVVESNDDDTQELIDNPDKRSWANRSDRRGRETQIALTRFKPTSTGYRLIEDATNA